MFGLYFNKNYLLIYLLIDTTVAWETEKKTNIYLSAKGRSLTSREGRIILIGTKVKKNKPRS